MALELTRHGFEMERREIPEDVLRSVLATPQQAVVERAGLAACQSRIAPGGRGDVLVQVIVDGRTDPQRVITVYRTNKVPKYW